MNSISTVSPSQFNAVIDHNIVICADRMTPNAKQPLTQCRVFLSPLIIHPINLNGVMLNWEATETLAKETLGWPENQKWNSKNKQVRFWNCFGAPSKVAAGLWNRIKAQGESESGGHLKHLLWALVHLEVCSTAKIHCSIVGWPSCKTFSKWAWHFVGRIAELKNTVIDLDQRFEGLNGVANANCFVSVDCTDCPVFEPFPFSRAMRLQKLNDPGLKCEVGVCIKTGKTIWPNGPFVGSESDGRIFRDKLSMPLCVDEAVEIDHGHKGNDKMKMPSLGFNSKERKMKHVNHFLHTHTGSFKICGRERVHGKNCGLRFWSASGSLHLGRQTYNYQT